MKSDPHAMKALILFTTLLLVGSTIVAHEPAVTATRGTFEEMHRNQ